jgi:hypothetical protein
MIDEDSVTEHLSTFNTVVSQLLSIYINISDEYKCISLLLALPDSWDILVVSMDSNETILTFNDEVSTLFLEEMRWENMKEIDLSPQVGDQFCKGMLEMWKRRELQEAM